jgi:hypothetical protein
MGVCSSESLINLVSFMLQLHLPLGPQRLTNEGSEQGLFKECYKGAWLDILGHLCSHPIGQDQLTWPQVTARETGKYGPVCAVREQRLCPTNSPTLWVTLLKAPPQYRLTWMHVQFLTKQFYLTATSTFARSQTHSWWTGAFRDTV